MASFRSYVWDPVLIICQILAMQCQFYVLFCTYVMIFSAFAHVQPTLAHVFSYKVLSDWHHGWPAIVSYALSTLSGALSLRYIVRRSKKCVDFTVTMFLVHLFLCFAIKAFPANWQWWLVTVLSAGAMVILGEWLCMRLEVSEIPVSVGNSGGSSAKHSLR